MRILITTGIYPPDIGGPATYVPQLAADLVKYGHSVEIITLGASAIVEKALNINVIVLKRNEPKLLRTLKVIVQISKSMRNADAVFSNGLFPETAISLCFKKKLNSVAKIVGDPVWEKARNQNKTNLTMAEFNNFKISLQFKLLRLIFKWSWNRFHVLTCPSSELQNFLYEFGVSPEVICVQNGVEIYELNSNSEKDYDLLCVARLVTWKNIDIVIRAAAELKLTLAIVGAGPEERNLRDLASSLGSDTKFYGQKTKHEVHEIMKKSRIFVQISDYEGLSFSLLEAMSLRLVPIVSANEGNRSVVVDRVNGAISPINLAALKEIIQNCLSDEKLFGILATAAHRTVLEKFNGEARRREMVNLITGSSNE